MTAYFQTVVVLTDQYPPDVLGGAELSLHTLLKGMRYHDKKVVVVTLSNRSSRDFYDGIEVIRVPFRYEWPRFVTEPTRLRRARSLAREAATAVARGNHQFFTVGATAYRAHKGYRSILGAFPHLDQQALQFNAVIDELRRVIGDLRPALIHADNYKSIVLAHCLDLQVPVVSLVRDNRFFCAHRNQATNVSGEICTACNLACVDGKASSAFIPKVKAAMEDTLQFRINALKASSAIVATSRYLADRLGTLLGGNISTIPNPVESAACISAMQRGVGRAAPPEILCVGMLSHNKGQLQLVQALPELQRQLGSNFRLVLAGRGALASQLESIAANHGLRDHLIIAGFLDRPALYRSYARSSVVVCPNIWPEPFGRVPWEAALSRRPVVAFDTGATSEHVIDGLTGWLVGSRDMEMLVERTVAMIRNPETADRIGAAAYQRVIDHQNRYDPSAALLSVWDTALAQAP